MGRTPIGVPAKTIKNLRLPTAKPNLPVSILLGLQAAHKEPETVCTTPGSCWH